MAAPKDNQFWKRRTKHGRDKIFATPEIMREACYEYFEFQSNRAWEKVEYKGSDVVEVRIPTTPPFTMTGLCIFLGVNTKYFNEFKKTCDNNFSEVIEEIENIIYNQKFEGASVGAYNANIIARDLGLADKKQEEVTKKKIIVTVKNDEE